MSEKTFDTICLICLWVVCALELVVFGGVVYVIATSPVWGC